MIQEPKDIVCESCGSKEIDFILFDRKHYVFAGGDTHEGSSVVHASKCKCGFEFVTRVQAAANKRALEISTNKILSNCR